MMDWQEQLKAFRNANPDLPEGTDPVPDPTPDDTPSMQARLDISLEKKGRAGKTATLISGWTVSDEKLLQIASDLKRKLACGGSARGDDILLQGDRRAQVVRLLQEMGYKSRTI